MYENVYKLFHPLRRLPPNLLLELLCATVRQTRSRSSQWKLTRCQADGLNVVFRHVVLDPGPVRVALLLRVRVAEEHLGHGPVPEGAWSQGHLEGEQILAVANVKEEPRVRGASCRVSLCQKRYTWRKGSAGSGTSWAGGIYPASPACSQSHRLRFQTTCSIRHAASSRGRCVSQSHWTRAPR